jgi:RecB family exonuclease
VDTLELPGVRRLYSCTPARLNAWLDCPRRYAFAYLVRPSPPRAGPWARLSLGSSVHAALAAWWRRPRARRTVAAAADVVAETWIPEGYRDAAHADHWRHRAADMVRRHLDGVDPAAEPLGLERTVAFRTDTIAFSGRVDRIDRRGPVAVAVDYKTGRQPPTEDDARGSLALALYARAIARTMHLDCTEVELHHLPSGTVATWRHSAESLDRHLRRAEAIAADCAQADDRYRAGLGEAGLPGVFPARVGGQCAWCEFRSSCPEGAAVPAAEPWAGLEES